MSTQRIEVVRARVAARIAADPPPPLEFGAKATDDHMLVFFVLGIGVAAAMLVGGGARSRG